MQEKLDELRQLVKGKKCPEYYEMELGDGGSCNENCQTCRGSKFNPAYAPLLEVVSAKGIPHPESITSGVFMLPAAAYWAAGSKGAFEGSLIRCAWRLARDKSSGLVERGKWAHTETLLYNALCADDREAALDAVIEALKEAT